MAKPEIQPHKITKPIQILAVWFVGLLALVGILLAGAANIEQPIWIPALLVVAAIVIIPLFIFLIFLLQTRFRTQFLDDEHYSEWLKRKEEAFDEIESRLDKSTKALVESNEKVIGNIEKKHGRIEEFTNKLLHIDKVGLIAVFAQRREAFKYIEDAIRSEENEIVIVGTSFRGLLWPGPGEEKIMKAISKQIRSGCKVKFLLTHPAFAHLRQKLEGIQRRESFHIAQEILETIKVLKMEGVPHSDIRFVKGTPTIFGIMTSKLILLNPYPYQRQAYNSISFVIDSKEGKNEVYRSFDQSHFSGVWNGRNVVELDGYDLLSVQKVFDSTLEKLNLCQSDKRLDYESYKTLLETTAEIE